MKRLSLSVIGLYLGILAAFSQTQKLPDTAYKPRKLELEEANFVSSYYSQHGNNSAVTGGIGTEKLNDFSNTFELKLHRWDKKNRKHTYDFELGIDHYTSASSDLVDLKANSSASHADTRFYPSANLTIENEQKGSSFGGGLSTSYEFDYFSLGGTINFAQKTRNRSGEFSGKLFGYLDNVKLVYPTELRTGNQAQRGDEYGSAARNTFGASLSYSQIVNQRLQLAFLLDLIHQDGYLGLPFHRVYFTNGTEKVENLPASRLKIPVGFRANYFLGDFLVLRAYYRYYKDDWGLSAHTASLETSVKFSPFLSCTPFYRYYAQTAVEYFAGYQLHKTTDTYYTSNYDLSAFSSSFYGAGIRLTPPKGVFGVEKINMLELRYGHYSRTNGMNSDIVSLNLRFR
ncbi:MAG: DUF3570 domain-containing protein [Chitinophagaceae bacterium]|nr:DUF3570 domain-containing protein [Chitinophagaceae bacterium]